MALKTKILNEKNSFSKFHGQHRHLTAIPLHMIQCHISQISFICSFNIGKEINSSVNPCPSMNRGVDKSHKPEKHYIYHWIPREKLVLRYQITTQFRGQVHNVKNLTGAVKVNTDILRHFPTISDTLRHSSLCLYFFTYLSFFMYFSLSLSFFNPHVFIIACLCLIYRYRDFHDISRNSLTFADILHKCCECYTALTKLSC